MIECVSERKEFTSGHDEREIGSAKYERKICAHLA